MTNQSHTTSADDQGWSQPEAATDQLPMGDHPLEVAARRGIGPLSTLANEHWHGQAKPCVSCGLLVMRDQRQCDHCGQDLSDVMLEKMRAHAGPWYVLEHLRPFPGVSLERIIRQINRGVLTETSIIRGPFTDFQWRFAVETPGICRHFGKCWKCHKDVSSSDLHCQHCLAYLEGVDKNGGALPASEAGSHVTPALTPAPTPAAGMAANRPIRESAKASNQNLQALSQALGHAEARRRDQNLDDPPRVGGIRAIWIAMFIIAVFVGVLLFLSSTRP